MLPIVESLANMSVEGSKPGPSLRSRPEARSYVQKSPRVFCRQTRRELVMTIRTLPSGDQA